MTRENKKNKMGRMMFMSVPQFAQKVGVSRQAVHKRIQNGNLKAVQVSPKAWAIPASEAKRWERVEAGAYMRLRKIGNRLKSD